jgi:glycylpeptide N-tetradecanoyltransferase
MASYKFWGTQPVPSFGQYPPVNPAKRKALQLDLEERKTTDVQDGPILPPELSKVKQQSAPLPEGYEWVTMDLTDETQVSHYFCLLHVIELCADHFSAG